MKFSLEPAELARCTYAGPSARAAHGVYLACRSETAREVVWRALCPRAAHFYYAVDLAPNPERADFFVSYMVESLWQYLPTVSAHMETQKHFDRYFHKVLRTAYWTAKSLWDALARPPEVEDILTCEDVVWSPQYGEGSMRWVEDKIYLSELPKALERRLRGLSVKRLGLRFAEPVVHVLRLLLSRQKPLPRMIQDVWGVDPNLVISWTWYQLRVLLEGKTEMMVRQGQEDPLAAV